MEIYGKERMEFHNVIFDLDSTLVSIEGIDELGRMVGKESEIQKLTDAAMRGDVTLEEVFEKRLQIIRPTKLHIKKLSQLYCNSITEGAVELISTLKQRGKKVFLVTGGYRNAIEDVVRKLGLKNEYVFANELLFYSNGTYKGFQKNIPLWKNHGKAQVALQILKRYPGKNIVIGDGISDLELGLVAGTFVYYGGHVWRENIAAGSNYVIKEKNLMKIFDLIDP